MGSVLAQDLQGALQLRQAVFSVRQGGDLLVQQCGIRLVSQIFRRFPELHTAHMKQARQQRVPVLGEGDEPDPFHFDNGH